MNNQGKQKGMGPGGTCVCPKCGEEVEHEAGKPCTEMSCVKCKEKMVRKGMLEEAENIVDNILNNMISIQEQSKDVTMNDVKELTDKLKQKGFKDTNKLQGVLNKANSIARQKGRVGDKRLVVGIMMAMIRGK